METAYRYPKAPGEPGVAVRPEDTVPVTELFVKSCFTEVPARVRPGDTVTLRGFAFSGAPDIARVELSDDDGASWKEAALDPRHDPWAWRLWSAAWTAGAGGRSRLLVRATDSRGATQPRSPVWNPSGYLANGWHAAEIEVTAQVGQTPRPESGSLPEPGARSTPLPDGGGKATAEASCTGCHSGDMLRQQHLTDRQWTASLTKMKGWGAQLSDEEAGRLLPYLVEHFGSGNAGFRPLPVRPVRR